MEGTPDKQDKSDGVPKTQSLSFNDANLADHRKPARQKPHSQIMGRSPNLRKVVVSRALTAGSRHEKRALWALFDTQLAMRQRGAQ
jgi:hypothetical protein